MKVYSRNKTYLFILAIFSLCRFGLFAQNNQKKCTELKSFDTLNHKNLQLNLYLDLIRYNTQEKIGILPYILKNPNGIFLEIGTGGDPIAEMLSQIPDTSHTTLIASDIAESVLQSLLDRHPKLQKYFDAKTGPKLELMRLDATDMHTVENEFLDGINASSVVHEIVSYAGGIIGLEKFFKESCRVLKPGGILVYRDPEFVSNQYDIVTISLKNKPIRLFAHVFLYKFLDKRGSNLAQEGRKIEVYKPGQITFTIFKKDGMQPSSLTYDEYLKVPSYDIDFTRKYLITLPFGLYRELARHYLTYLHQCNPLLFAKCTPDIFTGKFTINYFAHSTKQLIANFFEKEGTLREDGKITIEQKTSLEQHIEDNSQILEFGIPLSFKSQKAKCKLRALLDKHGLLSSNYLISLNKNSCTLDYRVFGLLYDEICQTIDITF